ncbi:MAG: cobalamin biosynthesis protein P47K [Planctomycetota bacterium]|nr:cobalamin biosynthesis protein P47K [Planctomycetota bacterium]
MLTPQYIMIGGFLGAGKTTAILQLAREFRERGRKVGLITNDQSFGLVDTTMLRSHGFATEEITGGCFCCRFGSLVEAAGKLTDDTQPDVFLAEPVGSCTDLRATVSYPLQQMYGDNYAVAPLSVVLDPFRTRQVLGLDQGKTFSAKVVYIFEKQLEEADILVINKCDLMDERQQSELQTALETRFPSATVIRISARNGSGISEWIAQIENNEQRRNESMDVDYDTYAEGESLLGWLNLSATLEGEEFDGNELLIALGKNIRLRLDQHSVEIAHLKMTLTPDSGNDLAVGNLVRNETSIELSHELVEPLDVGQLILNLRAEGDPEQLKQFAVEELKTLVAESQLTHTVEHVEAFRPGRPVPTHRLTGTT